MTRGARGTGYRTLEAQRVTEVEAVRQASVSELEDKLWHLLGLAEIHVESPQELSSRLRQIYHGIHDLDLSRYDPDELRPHIPALLARTFAARMAVRDRIPEWKARGLINRETV